jgi:hypothetical protein
MSTKDKNGANYENHRRAAELHDQAAHAHRSAAEHHGKQDHQTGQERSKHALEHSQKAFLDTEQLHRMEGKTHGHPELEHEKTAILAHELWEARGCPYGSPNEDWFHATEQLRSSQVAG